MEERTVSTHSGFEVEEGEQGAPVPQRESAYICIAKALVGGLAFVLVIGVIIGISQGGDPGCTVAGCSSCPDDLSICTECRTGYKTLTNATSNTTICEFQCTDRQIQTGCTVCSGPRACTLCSEGDEADARGMCYGGCSQNQRTTGCEECSEWWSDRSKCTRCIEGAELRNGRCTFDCTEEQSQAMCTVCSNHKNCIECRPGHGLAPFKGECVDECLAAGETDLGPDNLGPPRINNGVEFQRMCVDEDEANFFVLGDWGGFAIGENGKDNDKKYKGTNVKQGIFESPDPNAKYGSAGSTGKPYGYDWEMDGKAQKLIADQMQILAETRKPRFVVNVGDNFYWGGFEDTMCGGDPKLAWDNWRWDKLWKDIYNLPHPTHPDKQIPWFSVLGNHDYGGEHMDSGWDHQVYQTYKPGSHWRMPGLWWSQEVRYKRFKAEFIMLDGNYEDAKAQSVTKQNCCAYKWSAPGQPNGTCPLVNYTTLTYDTCTSWFHDNWAQEKVYLEEKLRASKAHWISIVTHYPGNCVEPSIKAMMKTWGVDMCIVGHTHWNIISQIGDEGETCTASQPCEDRPIQVLAGGGGGIVSEGQATPTNEMYGFADIKLTEDTLKAQIINWKGINPTNYPAEWNLKRRPKINLGETSTVSSVVL